MFGVTPAIWNVSQLGAVCFFNFFAYYTLTSLSQTLVESASKITGISQHAGYYSSFFSYLIFTFGHFVATPIVEIISPKWAIVSGLAGYVMYEASFLWMNEYFLYFSAAFSGFTGSLMWTGHFDYLAQNTQPHTLDRSCSTLWGISQISLIFGGSYLLVLYRFQTGDDFEMPLIRLVVGSFVVCGLIAVAIGCFLRKPAFKAEKYKIPYFKHLSEIVKMSYDRNILFLFFTFCYTGLEISFLTAIFPTMVSFTKGLGNTRDLNALSSIFAGIGNVSGCFVLSALGSRVRVIGRKKVVLAAATLHLACFVMIFLTFPNDAPLKPTDSHSYYPPKAFIVLLCAFLLGFGDTIFNQQVYTSLVDIYEANKRTEAFAVFRFFQSASGCIAMFYSAHVYLKTQFIMLTSFCVLATVFFFGVRETKFLPVATEDPETTLSQERRLVEED